MPCISVACLGWLPALAKPAFSSLEVLQRLDVLILIKIRPHGVGEVELAVGGLPEQEVAEPQLAARSDDEVGGMRALPVPERSWRGGRRPSPRRCPPA